MMTPEDIRQSAAECLDAGLLRWAREDGFLLVSDDPRRQKDTRSADEALLKAGFCFHIAQSLRYIDPGADLWQRIMREAPEEALTGEESCSPALFSLALRLLAVYVPPEAQPVLPLRIVLKAAALNDPDLASRRLPPLLAALLREKRPMPHAAGQYLAWAIHHIFPEV